MKNSFNEFKNQIPRFSDQEPGTKDRHKDRFDNYVTMYDYLKLQGKLSPSEFYRSYHVYSATAETYRQMTRMQDTSKMDMWIDDTVLVIRRKDCASDYVRKHCTPIDFHVSNDYTYILDSSQDYSASINPSTDNMPEAIFTHIEDLYHANHKPYYKVHNTVLDAMLHTRIDEIKIGDLKLPFTSFSILLPERNHTKISQIMVSFNPTSKPNTNNATISSDIAWNMHLCIISKSAVSLNMYIPLNHGDISVEQYIMTYLFHNSHPDKEYIIDIVPPALHIVCSVALLATGSHKYFEADVMDHLLLAYRRSRHKKREHIRRQSIRTGHTGYSIGRLDSERKLPNGVKYDEDVLSQFNRDKRDNESDTKQSRRMHIRCGHYRYQACGQRWQDHNLIWIMPMFVGLNNTGTKVA
jgi:hypothetical protein